MTGIEPVTPSLPRKCSTSEPHQHFNDINQSSLKILSKTVLVVKTFLKIVEASINFCLSSNPEF